ncbi:hypothetical protein ACOMHN_017199 [Nucella lapillus]
MDRDLQSVNRRWTGICSQGTDDGQGSPVREQTMDRDLHGSLVAGSTITLSSSSAGSEGFTGTALCMLHHI